MYISKVILSLSERYKIFTSDWLWIGICQNVVLSKINITMKTINKKRKKQKSKKKQKKKSTFARSRPATENPTQGS